MDEDEGYSPFPWGEIPWGPVLLFIVIFLLGAIMEAFNWFPGH